MGEIWAYLKDYLHIDPIVVLIVIGSGYFQYYYLRDWKLSAALKTLSVSSIVSLVYFGLQFFVGNFPKEVWAQYFLSYFLATSLYEILLAPIARYIKKRMDKITGGDENEAMGTGGDRPPTPPKNP